jgi:hypothetical protein
MKLACTVALVMLLGVATPAVRAQQANPAPVSEAARICQSGTGDRYGSPAGACWIAYELALTRQQMVSALAFVRIGCERYQRSDYCVFMNHLQRHPLAIEDGGSPAARNAVRRALERAESYVSPWDVEDGEVMYRRGIQSRTAWGH